MPAMRRRCATACHRSDGRVVVHVRVSSVECVMRVIPALGLCKLRKGSQSRTHDALLRQETSCPLTPSFAAHASGSLVHRCPDWGEPGRRDRHDQDSHVTSNTPPRSNTGSVMIGHAEGKCDCASCNCIVLHLQVLCIVLQVCCINMQVGFASSNIPI